MPIINYSPESHYPKTQFSHLSVLVARNGKQWLVDNLHTLKGEYNTNDYLPIAILGYQIRKGNISPELVTLIEFTHKGHKGNRIRFDMHGELVEPLDNEDAYQFECMFSEE